MKKNEDENKLKEKIYEINNNKNILIPKIIIIGEKNSGKTTFIENCRYLNIGKFEFIEINIFNLKEIEEYFEGKNNIFIFIIENDFNKIIINKKLIEKIIKLNKINKNKIKIILNKNDKYSINKKIINKLFKKIKIIGNIKFNKYYNFNLNKKNGNIIENKKLKIKYLKIIKKIGGDLLIAN